MLSPLETPPSRVGHQPPAPRTPPGFASSAPQQHAATGYGTTGREPGAGAAAVNLATLGGGQFSASAALGSGGGEHAVFSWEAPLTLPLPR